MECLLLFSTQNEWEKAVGTGFVPGINNCKINLSFPCHKLKAYRPHSMSITEVSAY